MNFNGQTVVITGGATGIGFALAKQFGMRGARLAIGEPSEQRLESAASALRSLGFEVVVQEMDVTDVDSIASFADFVETQFGRTDILINNAGVSLPPGRMFKKSISEVRALFDVNVFGVWQCAAEFGQRMIAREEPARIYNVGSENSFFNAAPGMTAYIASKHAVRGLTEAMAEDVPDFIKVGLICPGFVKSELTPPPFGDLAMNADQFAEIVLTQIEAGEFYIVSHAYNIERIKPVHAAIEAAYEKYAPRYEGDKEFDVRELINRSRRS